MQFKKAIASFISTIVLFSIAWMVLLFSQSILETNDNKNVNYVPSNALFAVRIDARELAETALFSIFLETKDDEILRMIQELSNENRSSDKKWIKDGVDYMSDIVFFQLEYKKERLNCFLVNVSNERFFKNAHSSKNELCAVNKGVGLIIPTNNGAKNKELQSLANTIVTSPQNGSLSSAISHPEAGRFIEVAFHSKKKNNSNFAIDLVQNSMMLNGETALISLKNSVPIQKRLQPKGLHISTGLIPVELSDSLNSWLSRFGVKVPAFKELSVNYISSTVVKHSSGFMVIPQMELYIDCAAPFSIQSLTESDSLARYFDFTLNEGWIELQDEKVYYKQISSTAFYIGMSKNPVFTDVPKDNYLIVSGKLSPLTDIKGGGLVRTILEMIPEYRAGKRFANRVEKIEVNLKKVNPKQAKLSGTIQFKSSYFPINEMLKLLITGKSLN